MIPKHITCSVIFVCEKYGLEWFDSHRSASSRTSLHRIWQIMILLYKMSVTGSGTCLANIWEGIIGAVVAPVLPKVFQKKLRGGSGLGRSTNKRHT